MRKHKLDTRFSPANLEIALWLLVVSTSTVISSQVAAQEGDSEKKNVPAAVTKADDDAAEEPTSSDEEQVAESDTKVKPAPAPTPWILKQYRVQILVSFENDPLLPASMRQSLLAATQAALNAEFHQMWIIEISEAVGDAWQTNEELVALSSEVATERFEQSDFDKVIFSTVSHEAGEYRVLGREWDENSRKLGSVHSAAIYGRQELVPTLAHVVAEAFRPVAELEVLNDSEIEFLIRAGEYLPRNEDMQQFQPGDFLVPYLRYLDRARTVQKIQEIPWTYLQVESVQRSRMKVTMTSAFRNPIAGARRRVEVMAIRIRPHLPATEVLIYPRGNRRNPLVGYRCEVMDRMPSEDDSVEDRLKLETDRRGIVTVPVNKEQPLQYLYVYSGQALLARVPFIPGYNRRLEIEVPDDTARLSVEGEVSLLQSELIDIVATREVLMARTRGAAKNNRWDDVNRFLKELEDLPTLTEFAGRIESLEVRAVYAADQARDRVAKSRIKKLAAKITESATSHLDPFRIAEFKREMDDLRKHSK